MSRFPALTLHVILLLSLVSVGCGGHGASQVGSRRLAVFPLDEPAALPESAADVAIEDDPVRGPVLFAAAERNRKVIVAETELTQQVVGPLNVVGHFRTEMIDAPVAWELRLESADGTVRFLGTPSYEYDRTTAWRVFQAEFELLEDEQPVRVTLAAMLPPGRLWVDAVEFWDGPPLAGATE